MTTFQSFMLSFVFGTTVGLYIAGIRFIISEKLKERREKKEKQQEE